MFEGEDAHFLAGRSLSKKGNCHGGREGVVLRGLVLARAISTLALKASTVSALTTGPGSWFHSLTTVKLGCKSDILAVAVGTALPALILTAIASKNNLYRLSFFPCTIREWNKLEPGAVEAGSFAQFKSELARTLLH
ncbi:hypothetical protein Bbelb_413810 [Branchiostoma belcheri]|nr:hypothetical protein Bbelb_413810 [Branchiostoma belcheri]